MVADDSKKWFGLTSHVMAGALLIHVILIPILYVNINKTFRNSAEEQFIGNARQIAGLLGDLFSVVGLANDIDKLSTFMDYVLLSGEIFLAHLPAKATAGIRNLAVAKVYHRRLQPKLPFIV